MIFKKAGIVYNRNKPHMELDSIHETQIDKKKIEKVIDKFYDIWWNGDLYENHWDDLKKELGLGG